MLRGALVRWYSGVGNEADHRASVVLVVAARENHKWLACDCLGGEADPPLMSPAYLSIAETYYLRRLTSAKLERPEHQLITLQYKLRRHHVMISAKKPLFDLLTSKGPMRPDLLLAAFNCETGEQREWAVQVPRCSLPQAQASTQG